jgi:hypothetical protein
MIHLNLKEVKITKVYVNKQKNSNYIFKKATFKTVKPFFVRSRQEKITDSGWYDKDGYHQIYAETIDYILKHKNYQLIGDELFYKANIVIHTSKGESFIEYFENNDSPLDDRLEEIRQEAKCDFFCVGND